MLGGPVAGVLRLLGEARTKSSEPAGLRAARGRRAVLAGVEVAGDGDVLGRQLEVGVVEHDHRRLAAELEVHCLTWSAAALATAMPAPTLPVIEAIAGVGCLISAALCRGRRRPR